MKQRYIDQTLFYDYCFVRKWESEEAITNLITSMIDHLDDVRVFIEELSPVITLTDPFSGNNVYL